MTDKHTHTHINIYDSHMKDYKYRKYRKKDLTLETNYEEVF